MIYSALTLKKLFALSGNECAYPGCPAPIVETDMDVVVGEICHIKGKSMNGPRYDSNQTDAERSGYENLLLMCGAHNKIIDDPKTRDKFPVELLKKFKQEHEVKHRNNVVDEVAMQSFVSHFEYVAGSVIITHQQNGGQNAHQITNIYHPPAYDEKEADERAWALYSDFYKASCEGYILNPEPGSEAHSLAERLVAKGMLIRLPPGMGYAIEGQQFVIGTDPKNKERREALRKIYEAANVLAGESGDPTDVTIYVSDEPTSGRRAVQLKNAYNTAKFLVKHGLIIFESEDAMSVKLTDAGIRAVTG